MTPDEKMTGLRRGSRVRIVMEGGFAEWDGDALYVEIDGFDGPFRIMGGSVKADTFQIEKIETPLSTGDRVKFVGQFLPTGIILAVHKNRAWVLWDQETEENPHSVFIGRLERKP